MKKYINDRGWYVPGEADTTGADTWSEYHFFDAAWKTEQPLALCVARDNECARDFAEVVEEHLCIDELRIQRVMEVDRRKDATFSSGYEYLGLSISHVLDTGEEMSEEQFNHVTRHLDYLLTANGLPGIMDGWREWPQARGSYFVGQKEVVDRIVNVINEGPNLGTTLHRHYPAAVFLSRSTAADFDQVHAHAEQINI